MARQATRRLAAVLLWASTLALLGGCGADLEEELSRSRAESRQWQTRYEALLDENREALRTVDTLEAENRDLQDRLERLSARTERLDELQQTVTSKQQRIAELEERLRQETRDVPADEPDESQAPVERVRARLSDLGAELFEAGQYDSARAALRSVLELGDQSVQTLYRLAYSEAAAGNLDAAAEHYAACLQALEADAEPDLPLRLKCLNNAGAVAQRQGRARQAADLYKRALERDERHTPAHFNLGLLYLQELDRPREGVEALRRHVALGGERTAAAAQLIRQAQQEDE